MRWKYFGGAAILAAGLVLKAGAPLAPVALGLAMAGWFNWTRLKSADAKKRTPTLG